MLKNRTTRSDHPHRQHRGHHRHARDQQTACPRNADSDFADTTHGTTRPPPNQPPPRHHRHRLDNHMRVVPLIPNDTPDASEHQRATRGRDQHSTAPADQSTCGLGIHVRRRQLMAHRQHQSRPPPPPAYDPYSTSPLTTKVLPAPRSCHKCGNAQAQSDPPTWSRSHALHHIHLGRAQPALANARTTRCCEGPLGAVHSTPHLINRRPDHHRQHRMTQPPRIRKPLQHQHPTALGPADPISPARRKACTGRRCQPTMPEFHEDRRCGVDI